MSAAARVFCPLGRLFLSLIFLASAYGKITRWDVTQDYMASEGLPATGILLVLALAAEIVGGLSVLLGLRARLGALILVLFLIPTTLIFHDFWGLEAEQAQNQMMHFLKNLGILGGLLLVVGLGPGPGSVDRR